MAYRQQAAKTGPGGFQYMNSPFGDTTFTNVFVGGLTWETQSETMGRYFEQFGEILVAVVIKDNKNGRSKYYGFVTFREPESARRACADPTPIIDGRKANCNLASLGRPRPAVLFDSLSSNSCVSFQFRTAATHGPGPKILKHNWDKIALDVLDLHHLILEVCQLLGSLHGKFWLPATCPLQCSTRHGVFSIWGVHNPYGSQQNLHICGVPGAVNTTIFPYSQLSLVIPGSHSYTALPGYAIPSHQIMHFAGPSVNSMTTNPVPNIPVPYPTVLNRKPRGKYVACIRFTYSTAATVHTTCSSPQFIEGSGSVPKSWVKS